MTSWPAGSTGPTRSADSFRPDQSERLTPPETAPAIRSTTGAQLSANEVEVRFGATLALRGVSVDFTTRESVAIVGSSGSGKSTLLQCLAGLRLPDSGYVSYNGRSMAELSDGERTKRRLADFGFVFQFGYLVPELSLVENVALPVWLAGTAKREARSMAAEMLERLGIAELADRTPSAVSGGQLQRAAVARALVHRPAVIFADEPTGALDSTNSRLVFEALLDQSEKLDSMLLVVTHEPGLAAMCDRVVTLSDGQIESDGADAIGPVDDDPVRR